jgi:FAD/FMN-containing dehydrogenase
MWMNLYDKVTRPRPGATSRAAVRRRRVAGLVQERAASGSFSKAFGTAAASLLQAEVVTADGKVRTVERVPGAGSVLRACAAAVAAVGAYVTKLTLRTHELPKWSRCGLGPRC